MSAIGLPMYVSTTSTVVVVDGKVVGDVDYWLGAWVRSCTYVEFHRSSHYCAILR
jgi:hypothetical protein